MPIKAIVDGAEKEITRIPVLADNVYKDAWEVRDNRDRLLWYREDTLTRTGVSSISFRGYGIPLKSVRIVGNGAQNGTPSPDNIIMPEFCGKLVGTDWIIPITNAGQTQNVYLGEVQTTRKIKNLVLTGQETTWIYEGEYERFGIPMYGMFVRGTRLVTLICSHYQCIDDGRTIGNVPNNSIYAVGGHTNMLFIKTNSYTTVDAFKTYLQEQYTNGTPVTIWYVLATPETAIVNEPLAKIGNYVDELVIDPNITPQTGTNTLTVDTTLSPSSVSITGHIKAIGQ